MRIWSPPLRVPALDVTPSHIDSEDRLSNAFEAWTGARVPVIRENDAAGRLELGNAYVAMEMYGEGITEMGLVLVHGEPGKGCERALDVLLDAHLLRERHELAMETLRQLLFAN